MNDIDDYMKKVEEEREDKWNAFLKKGADKVRDDNALLYEMIGLYIQNRFEIKNDWYGRVPDVVWTLAGHYVKEVDEPLDKWLHKDDSPMIKEIKEIKRIFPELYKIYNDDVKTVEAANQIYGLNINTDYNGIDEPDYIYSFSFDFNSFTPIDIKAIKELKEEKRILEKYGHNTKKIDKKLSNFGLTEKELEVL